jgi:hypothetical protein
MSKSLYLYLQIPPLDTSKTVAVVLYHLVHRREFPVLAAGSVRSWAAVAVVLFCPLGDLVGPV